MQQVCIHQNMYILHSAISPRWTSAALKAAWWIRIFFVWSPPPLPSVLPSGPRTCWGSRGRRYGYISASASHFNGIFDTNPGALRVLLLNGDILLGLNANFEFVSVWWGWLREKFACLSTRSRFECRTPLLLRFFEGWTHRTWNGNDN